MAQDIEQDLVRTSDGQREQLYTPRILYIRTLIKGLDQPFVPFTLLKNDPSVSLGLYQQQRYEQLLKTSAIERISERAAWNSLFHELRLDQLFFVCAWSSVPNASLNVIRTAGFSLLMTSAGPQQRRWLVTRPVWRRGELVAWCEIIDTAELAGDQVKEIILSERNMLRLVTTDILQPY